MEESYTLEKKLRIRILFPFNFSMSNDTSIVTNLYLDYHFLHRLLPIHVTLGNGFSYVKISSYLVI